MAWIKNFFTFVGFSFSAFFIFFAILMVIVFSSFSGIEKNFFDMDSAGRRQVLENSILEIKITGVIVDSKKFLDHIRYAEKDEIKGVLVNINSGGGSAGVSQEIYSEILRVKNELKKPVVAVSSVVLASGAYYSALGANKIIVGQGALVGSIGVIMMFLNLEKLYNWAKIDSYVVASGHFKDAGSAHRPLTAKERNYYQSLVENVYRQFRKDVKTNRNLTDETMSKYADDGRVFTGQQAVDWGFADKVGSRRDALELLGSLSGLGKKPRVFNPEGAYPFSILELLSELKATLSSKSPVNSLLNAPVVSNRLKLIGKPLAIIPHWIE